jgi:hypothetical protein
MPNTPAPAPSGTCGWWRVARAVAPHRPYSCRMPHPAERRDDRPPEGWTAGILFDALLPVVIGIAILAFLAGAFIGSSSSYPGF